MPSIFRLLEKILENTDDYVSQDAALFFEGLTGELPQKIVIVTSSRRRNRELDDFQIEFVFHHAKRPRESRTTIFQGAKIRVAKLSQALVDIVADCCQAQELDNHARIFWNLAFNVDETIDLAKRTSNTALKRILFWVAWAGRLRFTDLPKKLERTPVKLLQNCPDKQLWEGALKLFYPRSLLGKVLPQPNLSMLPELENWLKLRSSPQFCEYAEKAEWLPIAEDEREKSRELLEAFFKIELARMTEENLTLLLEQLQEAAGNHETLLPRLFLDWVLSSSFFPDQYRPNLENWVNEKLAADNPRHWEIAFVYATITGKIEQAFSRIIKSAAEIFNSGRFRGIEEICSYAENNGIKVPRPALILLSRIFARLNLFEEALLQLEKASAGELSAREEIDIAFCAGIINRQAGRLEESIRLLHTAANKASSAGLHENAAAILLSIGNVYLARGELAQARRNYLKASECLPSGTRARIIANIQTNLGLVEFRSGNLKRADRFFSQALENQKLNENLQGTISSSILLGRIKLARGRFLDASDSFAQAEEKLSSMVSDTERREVLALIAWVYQLLGHSATSEKYWDKAEIKTAGHNPGAEFLFLLLKALRSLIKGEIETSAELFAQTVDFGRKAKIVVEDLAVAQFYQAICVHQHDRLAALTLFKELPTDYLQKSDHPFQLFANVYLGLSFPGVFTEIDVANCLARINLSDYYEPTWFLIAEQLYNYGSASAMEMLKTHINKIPPEAQKLYEQIFPKLKRLFKKLKTPAAEKKNFTLLVNGKKSIVSEDEFNRILIEAQPGTFFFNGITGELKFSDKTSRLKPKTILHRMLVCLLLAFPEDLSSENLYEMVWGGKFEAEFCGIAFKAAMMRLRKVLEKICPTLRIEMDMNQGKVRIILGSSFIAIF